MSALDVKEGPLFVAACRRQPWLVPVYAAELALLVGRRLGNGLRLRHRSNRPHLGLKMRPRWLPPLPAISDRPGGVDGSSGFPVYSDLGASYPAAIPPLAYATDDPEAALAANRWSRAVHAALGDAVALGEAEREIAAWLASPPPFTHAAWEPYSASERVANLGVLLAVEPGCGQRLGWPRLRRLLAEHARWIESRLEYYGPGRTNNHVLNNARALVIAGATIADRAAVVAGLAILDRMAPELIDAHGFLRERSSHYQVVIANWVLDASHFARHAVAAGLLPPSAIAPLEQRAVQVGSSTALLTAALAGEGAQPALSVHIGDISPDLQPPLSVGRLSRLYPGAFGPASATFGSVSRGPWIIAARGEDRLVACLPASPWPEPFATHGHADLGSFIWLRQGKVILADPGRASYGGGATVAAQIGGESHNGLRVDGADALAGSVLRNGRWSPTPYARAHLTRESFDGGFAVTHDGFGRLGGVGRHERRVVLTASGVGVRDRLVGNRRARVELAWHLAPGFVPDRSAPGLARGNGLRIAFDARSSDGRPPELTWYDYPFSAAYGSSVPASVLRCSWTLDLPCTITSEITLEVDHDAGSR